MCTSELLAKRIVGILEAHAVTEDGLLAERAVALITAILEQNPVEEPMLNDLPIV